MKRIEVYSSSLESEVFGMVALGALVTERTEKVAPDEMPALSVGQRGVTSQLDGVAKQTTDGSRKLVRSGDLVINSRADRRGASGVASQNGSVSLVYSVMKPNLNILEPRFGHHLLRSVGFQEEFFRWGTGIVSDLWSTNFTRMGRIRVPIPSLPTQRCIADYLDRETGEIDAMIAKMDQLAEQLEARRATVIETVTRGRFSPLGAEVPGVPIGVVGSVVLGKMLDAKKSRPADATDLPYIRAANIQGDGLRLEDVKTMPFTSREINNLDLRKNDILVVEGGAVGTAVLLPEDMTGWSFQKTVNRIRLGSTVDPRWLVYVLRSYRDEGLFDLICSGTTIAHLTAEKLSALRVPLVDAAEQRRIADHLDQVTSRIDQMLAKVAELKSLLTERRAALITEVVTGRKEVA